MHHHLLKRAAKILFAMILVFSVDCVANIRTAVGQVNVSIPMSSDEEEAYQLASQEKFIKARTVAEKVLDQNKDSIMAHYVMALVFHNGEGDLLRALREYKKTLQLFEARYFTQNEPPQAYDLQALHLQLHRESAFLYAELDQRQNQLDVYDRIKDLYGKPWGVDASWALMKLGRYEEAIAIDRAAINGEDRFARSTAYNDLSAIEDSQHHYLGANEMGARALEFTRGKDCVILINQARNEMYFIRSEVASELVQRALKTKDNSCPTPPALDAVDPYLMRGEFQKAISAMKQARQTPITKRMRVQTEMAVRTTLSAMLMSLGFSDKAKTLMKTVINAPGRMGYNSISIEHQILTNNILYYEILKVDIERLKNKIVLYKYGHPGWLFDSEKRKEVRKMYSELDEMRREKWTATQKAIRAMLNPDNIRSLVVPYYVLSPLFYDAIVELAGRGTMRSIIKIERENITEEEINLFEPAWQSVEGYILWREGKYEKALEALSRADARFTRDQFLMTMLNYAVRGACFAEMGKYSEAYDAFRRVMRDYPVVMPQYGIRLPVTLSDSIVSALRPMAETVMALDVFEQREDSPFVIDARREGDWLVMCLNEKGGTRIACSSVIPKEYGLGDGEIAEDWMVMNQFVRTVFQTRVDLSQADLHSLDGSPIRTSAREALDGLVF